MTPDDLKERARLLTAKREELFTEINRLGIEAQHLTGAIQDCEFWVARLEAQAAEAPSAPRLVTTEE
jgi:hypothetical protein